MAQARVPTMADAYTAADVVAREGASQVLLFGSLARGDARAGSDIDLVAVFDDLDYGERLRTEWRLKEAIGKHVGIEADVVVTDRPEWRMRSGGAVPYSFEPVVAQHAVLLIDHPAQCDVDWDKPMSLPTNALEEAGERVRHIGDHWANISERQATNNALVERRVWRDDLDFDTYTYYRYSRFRHLCDQAQLAIEACLKTLLILYCERTPSYLFTHNTGFLSEELAKHAPTQAEHLESLLEGVPHTEISAWHGRANYHNAQIRQDHPATPRATAEMLHLALRFTEYTLEEYLRIAGEQANAKLARRILDDAQWVIESIGGDGEGLDPPDLPGDTEPHPAELEQLHTERWFETRRQEDDS